jgi:hypothetical protein
LKNKNLVNLPTNTTPPTSRSNRPLKTGLKLLPKNG